MDTNVVGTLSGSSKQELLTLFVAIAVVFAPPVLFYVFRSWLPAGTTREKRFVSRLSGVSLVWLFCAMAFAIGAVLR